MSGTAADPQRIRRRFSRIGGRVFANGVTYFQLGRMWFSPFAFAPALRAAVIETFTEIADQCDGVCCDMAMLVMNDIFARTWNERAGPAPEHRLLANSDQRRARTPIPDSCS